MFSCILVFASPTFAVPYADLPDIMNCLSLCFKNLPYITLRADFSNKSMFLQHSVQFECPTSATNLSLNLSKLDFRWVSNRTYSLSITIYLDLLPGYLAVIKTAVARALSSLPNHPHLF